MSFLGNIKAFALTGASPAWKIYLRLRGVSTGKALVVIGRPGINRKRGSTIRLGNHVTLCSSGMANPVAEGGRCRLATLAPGAELILHDGVGMSSTLICCAARVEIGDGTQIGGGAMILDTDFHPRSENGDWLTDPAAVAKPVRIGKNCFIGARAIILKGVTIGNGAVIGAGAVVTKDVPEGAVMVGNPARSVSARTTA
jgi:acetyltransferase-like isoleucine patch superfamily enzyme